MRTDVCLEHTHTHVCTCVPAHKQKGQLRLPRPVPRSERLTSEEAAVTDGANLVESSRGEKPAWEPAGPPLTHWPRETHLGTEVYGVARCGGLGFFCLWGKKRERKKMNSAFRGNGSWMCPQPCPRASCRRAPCPRAPAAAPCPRAPAAAPCVLAVEHGLRAQALMSRHGELWSDGAFLGTGWQARGSNGFPRQVSMASHLRPDTEVVQRWQERGWWA